MKTKQELLDFYGVEIGKKYRITKTANGIDNSFEGEIFRILENTERKDGLEVVFYTYGHPLAVLNFLDYEEYKPILDDKEREYLQKYIMDNPAFKGKVSTIHKSCFKEYDNITIVLTNGERLFLPSFKINSMYKNMISFYSYTPQELGLKE